MIASRFLALAVAVAVVVVLDVAPVAAAEEALPVVGTDISAFPDVRMVVAAPASLADDTLPATAFGVSEDGQPRAVRVDPLPAGQVEVALVIDTSASMAGAALAGAKAAARSFLAQLPPTQPVSVVSFGASPTVVSTRSSDRPAQAAAISALKARGPTALYDALGVALAQLPSGSSSGRTIVLLTDGGDTASSNTLEATAQALSAAQVPLFAVDLQTRESSPEALSRLTSASAGRMVPAADPAGLSAAFLEIARQLVRQYALTYRAETQGASQVDVTVEAKGIRAATRLRLELPASTAPPPSPASPAATATTETDATPPLGVWALIGGVVLCGAAMLILFLGVLGSRTPRARGLDSRKRTVGLASAANRAEALGDTMLRRRGGPALGRTIEAAGADIRPGELLTGLVIVALALATAGWVLVGPLLGLLLAVAVPLVAAVVLRFLASKRRRRFSDQLSVTLQILSGALRAGHGIAQGIDTVAREAESPTSEEFRRLTIETRLGRDLIDALTAMADRVGSQDFEWVIQAIEIQREIGGDLAEVFDTVSNTIRDRTRIRLQAAALSAEGRVSALVLLVLPFGLGAVMAVANPEYLTPLFRSGTGYALLAVGAVLMSVGALWLKKIVKPIF